jgi:glycosyltransferase involved in cell wall biosynthesis
LEERTGAQNSYSVVETGVDTQGGPVADVTVIIPTHNRRVLLARTLHSVLSQRGVDFAVVVVDDGGADGTSERVEALGDPRITVVRHSVPRGVSAARNSGIALSDTPWLAFVDDDDLWAPTKLQAQLETLRGAESKGWSCTGAVDVDSQCRLLWQHGAVPDPDGVATQLLMRNVIPGGGSGVMAARLLVESVGGFDEALSNLADWDFYVRLGLAGSLAPVPPPLLAYYVHPQGMAHDVARSIREFAYLDVKYGRQRRERQVVLDAGDWLSYLATLAYSGRRRGMGARLQWQLLVRHHRPPSVKTVLKGWAPTEVLDIYYERRRVVLPDGWGPAIEAWLPSYTSGWLDAASVDAGGRYDRVAALRDARIH